MFTVLDALMRHPVPFRDAGRLTTVVVAKEKMFMPTAAPAARLHGRGRGAVRVVLEGAPGSSAAHSRP